MTKIIFANPTAGNALAGKLDAKNHQLITDINQYDDIIATLPPNTHVIAAGGDGTVHLLINKLFQANKLDSIKFSVLPMGTGNDLARGLDSLRVNLSDLLQTTVTEKVLPLWQMTRQYNTTTEQRVFINFIGIGMDAKIVTTAERHRHYRNRIVTQLIYAIAGIRHCFYRLPRNTQIITDQGLITCRSGIIFASNNSYASGCRIGNLAANFTGKLNVISLQSWWQLLKILATRLRRHTCYPAVQQTTQVNITGENLALELDGEYLLPNPGLTTITIQPCAQSLHLILPK